MMVVFGKNQETQPKFGENQELSPKIQSKKMGERDVSKSGREGLVVRSGVCGLRRKTNRSCPQHLALLEKPP